jgi:MscS family membrane protein
VKAWRLGIFLVWLGGFAAHAQLGLPKSTPPAAPAPQDPLGRTTPRGTVLGFLNAARKSDFDTAAQYLNTRLRGKLAAEQALQLFTVLDRRLPPRLTQISDQPEGSLRDLADPNQDYVGAISSVNGDVDVMVERVERGKLGMVWLFSGKTLDGVPSLYEEVNSVPESHLVPQFLVDTRIAGVTLAEWLGLIVGLPLVYLVTVFVNRGASRAAGAVRRRLRRRADLPDPHLLPGPLRFLVLAVVIRWTLARVSMPLLARQIWSIASVLITIGACVWLLMQVTARGETYLRRRLGRRHFSGTAPLLRFVRRAADLVVIFLGVVAALSYFGVNPTAALAGLGVGGIAIALAAQKTLENVIGGLSLIFDRTVEVGDTLRVSGAEGTVSDIGLRSTRLRTVDRTVVSVPNGQVANASLENLSVRDKFWFRHILGLRYETTASQIRAILEEINHLLAGHSRVEAESVRVRFLRFGESSLDVELFAYLMARDWGHFLEIQQELLLRIMDVVERAGTSMAFPSRTLYLAQAGQANPLSDGRGSEAVVEPRPKGAVG